MQCILAVVVVIIIKACESLFERCTCMDGCSSLTLSLYYSYYSHSGYQFTNYVHIANFHQSFSQCSQEAEGEIY